MEPPRVPDPRMIPQTAPQRPWSPASLVPPNNPAPRPPRTWPSQPQPSQARPSEFGSSEFGPDLSRVAGSTEDPSQGLDVDSARVRPFIVTGGRTRPLHDGMRIESLLLATPAALSAPLRFEQRRIIELAQRAVSLAEVAATLAIPIGVARVLASDLHHGNLIRLLEPHELSINTIERIRDLVRAL